MGGVVVKSGEVGGVERRGVGFYHGGVSMECRCQWSESERLCMTISLERSSLTYKDWHPRPLPSGVSSG